MTYYAMVAYNQSEQFLFRDSKGMDHWEAPQRGRHAGYKLVKFEDASNAMEDAKTRISHIIDLHKADPKNLGYYGHAYLRPYAGLVEFFDKGIAALS